jgi:hypothetical protein
MSDQTFVTPPFIGTFCRWSVGLEARTTSGAPTYASGAWNVANQAVYIPFWLPWPYPVSEAVVGQRLRGGRQLGHRPVHAQRQASSTRAGSTAGSGNSVPQFVSPDDGAAVWLRAGTSLRWISH